jgi:hypothetical protein
MQSGLVDFGPIGPVVFGVGVFLFWYGLPRAGSVKSFATSQAYTFAVILPLAVGFALTLNWVIG